MPCILKGSVWCYDVGVGDRQMPKLSLFGRRGLGRDFCFPVWSHMSLTSAPGLWTWSSLRVWKCVDFVCAHAFPNLPSPRLCVQGLLNVHASVCPHVGDRAPRCSGKRLLACQSDWAHRLQFQASETVGMRGASTVPASGSPEGNPNGPSHSNTTRSRGQISGCMQMGGVIK